MATIDITTGTTYQTSRGWESTDFLGQFGNFVAKYMNWSEEVLDKIVALGINRVRLELLASAENSTDWWGDYLAGTRPLSDWATNQCAVVNDDGNSSNINASGFKWTRLDWTIDRVITPLRNRLLARGETLWVNITYVTAINMTNSQFHRDSTAEYAELALATVQHIESTYGWVPDSWTIVNEPDNSGVFWSSDNGTILGNHAKATGDKFAAAGYSNIAIILPETTLASNADLYYDNAIAVSGASAYIKGISYHRYAETVTDGMLTAVADRVTSTVLSGMTEHISADYTELHKDLTLAKCSYWAQYTMAGPDSDINDDGGQYFIIDDSSLESPTVSDGSRTRYLRQYFKYIRHGAVRCLASSGNANLEAVAYKNTNDRYVVVIKAAASVSNFTVGGLPAGVYGIQYSTASANGTNLSDATISAGQSITTSIPAAGVLTIYWKVDQGETYTLSSTDESFNHAGGKGCVTVTTSAGAKWTAETNDPSWLSHIGQRYFTGTQTLVYSVGTQPKAGSRAGTITIANQTFTVNQVTS